MGGPGSGRKKGIGKIGKQVNITDISKNKKGKYTLTARNKTYGFAEGGVTGIRKNTKGGEGKGQGARVYSRGATNQLSPKNKLWLSKKGRKYVKKADPLNWGKLG